MIAPYLAADAAALGDAELVPKALALRPLTDPVLQELEYACELFRRADSAVSTELAVLRNVDVEIDWKAVQAACWTLVSTSVVLGIRAMRERERREAA